MLANVYRSVQRLTRRHVVSSISGRRNFPSINLRFLACASNNTDKGKSLDLDDVMLQQSTKFSDEDFPKDIKKSTQENAPNFNIDDMIMNSSSDDNPNNEAFFDDEDSYMGDDEIAAQILDIALQYVPQYGWSNKAIEKAVESLDLSPSSAAMFKRGGVDLVLHFLEECNNKLAEHLSTETRENKNIKNISQTEFIENAIKLRLSMLIPYIESWPQAMTLLASPNAIADCFESGANMIDEIWYHAGDLSTDMSWYTKRVALAGVYAASELFMLNDRSVDFEETWLFLKRRLSDLKAAKSAKDSLDNAANDIVNLASAGITTAQNILGFNSKRRH